MICEICKKEFKPQYLSNHLSRVHPEINKKEYYDKYLKKDNEGKCKICGKETTFENVSIGYPYTYCSSKCLNSDEIVRNKIKETNIKKFGVPFNTQSDYYKKLNRDIWKNKSKEEITEIRNKNKQTCLKNFGVDNPAKDNEIKEKIKNTCLERYGGTAPMQNKEVKEKSKKTCLEKYGVDNIRKSEKHINEWLIKKGFNVKNEDKYKFYEYEKIIRNLTEINKKELFEKWDGYDYYDGEYIKDNLNMNSNNKYYPTIDHKISKFFGFKNNIPAEDVGNIENLCITKRCINSIKNIKNSKDFKK